MKTRRALEEMSRLADRYRVRNDGKFRLKNVGPDDTKATNHYHWTLSMFTDAGFVPIATHDNVTVVRKTLK